MSAFWQGAGFIVTCLAVAGFLSKVLVKQVLKKDLEKYKVSLDRGKVI
jgi:hypothetical protein